MNNIARIYRAEILRAVLGSGAHEAKAADIERLNRIAEHLASCEDAQAALRAKGYGTSGMTFIEVVREVPASAPRWLKNLFASKLVAKPHPGLGEVHGSWGAR